MNLNQIGVCMREGENRVGKGGLYDIGVSGTLWWKIFVEVQFRKKEK